MDFNKINKTLSNNIVYNNKLNNLDYNIASKYLKIYHLNIRSYKKNNLELWTFLDTLQFKYDIIILTEYYAHYTINQYDLFYIITFHYQY